MRISYHSTYFFLIRLSSLVLMRYLSFEEAALRRMHTRTGAGTGALNEKKTNSHSHSNSHSHGQINWDEDGDSSEDEAYAAASPPAGDGGSKQASYADGVLNVAEFAREKHDAYKSPALIVLEGMMDFTHDQFQRNLGWIVPLLSRLIICDDVEVRVCVRQIYQSFVNFLLIK